MAFPGRPKIYNLTLASANTEYSQPMSDTTFKIMVKARTSVDLKMSYEEGESGSIYFTIPAGLAYWDDNITMYRTIYLQCATAGTVAEILAWEGA